MRSITETIAAAGMGIALLRPAGPFPALGGPPQQTLPEGIRGGSERVPEPGVERHSCRFEATGETLPCPGFVSSKVTPDQPAPPLDWPASSASHAA